ncbi:MAG: carboxypeptidase regulatory-like domain-containing protein [Planctomycetes bacterium]|nr:carboxypeptidase regulatory-like domain-containing protein [Planctomycetota bacterium]
MAQRTRTLLVAAALLAALAVVCLLVLADRGNQDTPVVLETGQGVLAGADSPNVTLPDIEAPPLPDRSEAAVREDVLEGFVLWALDRSPVADGEVVLLSEPPPFVRLPALAHSEFPRQGRADAVPLARGSIAADGSFELRGPRLRGFLRALSPFAATRDLVRVDAAGGPGLVTVLVVPAGVVRGAARPPSGAGLAAERVMLQPALDAMEIMREGLTWRSGTTACGEDGRFEFTGVPAEAAMVCRVKPEGLLPAAERLTLAPGETAQILLVAGQGAALRGRIMSERGEPIAEARVTARKAETTFMLAKIDPYDLDAVERRSDASGNFEISGLPADRYSLTVRAEGFSPATLRRVELPAGGLELADPIVLKGGERIAGTVVDDQDHPVPGASVGFIQPRGFLGMGVTKSVPPESAEDFGGSVTRADDNGCFVSPALEPGSYDVTARADGMTTGHLERVDTGTSDHTVVLERHGSISGIVLSRVDAEPIQRYVAAATRPFDILDAKSFAPSPLEHVASADGTFTLHKLEAGTWRIRVRADGHGVESTPEIELRPGEEVRGVILILPPEAAIRGVVLEALTGSPVPNALVSTRASNTLIQPDPIAPYSDTHTDASGRFAITGLKAGAHRLSVTARSYAPGSSARVLLGDGQVAEGVVIRLERGAVIRGTGTAADGSPRGGDVVLATVAGNLMPIMTNTDAEGRYQLTGLAAGSYTVQKLGGSIDIGSETMMSSLVEGLATRTVRLKAGEEKVVDFAGGEAAGVTVRGMVTEGSEPLRGAFLSFTPGEGGGGIQEGLRLTAVDDKGRYEVKNMPAGEWTVTIQGGSSLSATTRQSFDVTIPEVEEYELDFALDATGIEGGVCAAAFHKVISGARVSIDTLDEGATVDAVTRAARSRRVVDLFTGKDGRFRATGLPPGRYSVAAGGPGMFGIGACGYCRSEPLLVEVKDGELTSGVDFLLEPGGALNGQVSDASGRPIQGATLFFLRNNEVEAHFGEILTGESGAYSADGMRSGVYSIVVKAQGFAPGVAAGVHVRTSEVTERDIELCVGANLVVEVRDAVGQPVSAASIRLFDSAGTELTRFITFGEALSEAFGGHQQGRYDLGALQPGVYSATITSGAGAASLDIQHGASDQVVQVVLQ